MWYCINPYICSTLNLDAIIYCFCLLASCLLPPTFLPAEAFTGCLHATRSFVRHGEARRAQSNLDEFIKHVFLKPTVWGRRLLALLLACSEARPNGPLVNEFLRWHQCGISNSIRLKMIIRTPFSIITAATFATVATVASIAPAPCN